MTLRRRLTLTFAVLLMVGLAVAGLVTYMSVRSFLNGRLDEQIAASQHQAYDYLVHDRAENRTPDDRGLNSHVAPDVYVEVLGRGGTVVLDRPSGTPGDPAPFLPADTRIQLSPRVHDFGRRSGVYQPQPDAFTTPAKGDHPAYRAQAVAVPQGVLITAISTESTEQTLSSLVRIELLVSLVMLAGLCVAALWTVRRGLRPLEQMAATADVIAAGNLTERVAAPGGRTETGRLGLALNGMLAEIETAFADKSASEGRLRQFVADASHELRTPLTSIRGYTELLRKGAFPDQEGRERALLRVEQEAIRMGGLVDDLLLLARLDQGRPLQHDPVDLARLGTDAVADARVADPNRPLTLVAPEPVLVWGDADRLRQVANNLVRNAQDHTPPGTAITVEVARRGAMGVLEVRDAGPGLEPATAARVFDRFYRGEPSRRGQGTGLGLSIVRAIAQALGGTARVESTPGQGAVFTVAIPLRDDGLAAGAPTPRTTGEPVARRPQLTR